MNSFLNAISLLPDDYKNIFSKIPAEYAKKTNEIRFRAGLPVTLNTLTDVYLVGVDGSLSFSENGSTVYCDERKLQEIVFSLSRRSIHTYQDMIIKGFIPLRGGCKAGVTGCAVVKNGTVYSVSSFNSVNIRVSREYSGSSDDVFNSVGKKCTSFLLVGPPLSGKTTVLRDLCRKYSSLNGGLSKKVAVIDERDEIASVAFGKCLQLGTQTDVLSLYPKAIGADIALRTLSPDIIMLDEIGADDEVNVLLSSLNTGVNIVATAHGRNFTEVLKRPNISCLIDNGVFEKVVVLEGKTSPCKVKEVISL